MSDPRSLHADERAELERLRRRVDALERQVQVRQAVSEGDQRQLERLVQERTAELQATSQRLRLETAELAVALRRQRLLAKAVEAVREGIAITDADLGEAGPKLLFVNDFFLEMTGYEVEELVGSTRLLQIYTPQRNSKALRDLRDCLTRGCSFTGELICQRRNGDEVVVLTHVSPVFDEDGELTHLVSIQQDITEQRRHERQLKRSEQRYRLLIEKMNEGFVATDVDNRIDLANAKFTEWVGYSQEALRGEALQRFVHPDSLPRLHKQERRRRTGVAEPYELSWATRDGERVETIISPTSLLDDHGEFIGSFAVITDITQRKRLEERIQKAQKMESLGLLAGGVAHDFNNLLVGMMGHASLALLELADNSPVRPLVQQIETAALRASELTKEMLAYSGRGKFVIEPVSLSDLVQEIASLLRVSISKKVELQFDIQAALPRTEGDPTQLRQIVMNLLTNASEAIGDRPGTITLRTSTMFAGRDYLAGTYMDDDLDAQEYVYLEVEDSGCGMDAETRAKIFDPFFTTKFTGRGLGLAAVLGIVRGHHGAISVDSRPAKGSKIRVLFPALSEGAHEVEEEDEAPATGPLGFEGSGTVLVVDDEALVRGVARMSLEAAGYAVMCAEDGAEAIDTFQRHLPDISAVLLDLTMPRMGGEEALRGILELNPDARVLLTSGFMESEAVQRVDSGASVAFLQKPFQPHELLSTLQRLLKS